MRSLFWVCAALVVTAGVMSTNLWRELRAERERTASLRNEVAEAAAREIRVAQTPPPVAPAPVAAAAEQPAPAPEKPAVAAPATPPVPTAATLELRDFTAQQRELWKDPEYRKARLAQARAQVGRNYPGLGEELGLSAAEESRLLDLLADYDVNMNAAISELSPASNDPTTSQQMSNRLMEIQKQRDAAIYAALGTDGKARWEQYQQTAAGRSQANSYNTMLSQAGMPMSATQLKSLSAAVVTEQKRQREETMALTRNVNPQDPASIALVEPELRKRQADYNERLLAAAAPILSAQQMELLRAQIEQSNAMSRAMERARQRAIEAQAQQGAQ